MEAAQQIQYNKVGEDRQGFGIGTGSAVDRVLQNPNIRQAFQAVLNNPTQGRNAVLGIFLPWTMQPTLDAEFSIFIQMMGRRSCGDHIIKHITFDAIYDAMRNGRTVLNYNNVNIVPILIEYICYTCAWFAVLRLERTLAPAGAVDQQTEEFRLAAEAYHQITELRKGDLPVR